MLFTFAFIFSHFVETVSLIPSTILPKSFGSLFQASLINLQPSSKRAQNFSTSIPRASRVIDKVCLMLSTKSSIIPITNETALSQIFLNSFPTLEK